MRTIRRTVIILGCVGFIALYILQYVAALAVTPLILVMGVLTGLAIAKWLPWAWYGRQFAAGMRAGVVACGLSAAGVLLSLVGIGSPRLTTPASQSHLPGIDMTHLATAFGSRGWFTPYVLLTIFFTFGGVLLAGAVAQIFGWSKSIHTVRVITQAHNAAASLHRSQTWAPAANSAPSMGGYWNSMDPSVGPASHPGLLATGAVPSAGHPAATHAPISGGALGVRDVPFEEQATYLAPLPSLDFDERDMVPPLPSAPEQIPLRRTTSGVQPVHTALTDDLRSALARWDEDAKAESADKDKGKDEESAAPKKTASAKKSASPKAKTPAKRQPKASAYLNSEPPAAPRRNRKKQETRDWLC